MLYTISLYIKHGQVSVRLTVGMASSVANDMTMGFMVQGKINRGRNTHHPAVRHSIRTNQCPPPLSRIFFTGRMPFQQRQSTEGN